MVGFRFWSLSALYTAGSALLLGIPTRLIPTPLFSRMVPTSPQDYVIWIVSALLLGPLHEVGSRRVASASRLGRVFPKRSLLLSDCPTRPTSARFQLPLPEPCRLLSQHTALQGCGSTCLGLTRHPPHPLGCVHPPLRPFTLSWALPQAFGYYDRSATLNLSVGRWSHRLTSRLVRL